MTTTTAKLDGHAVCKIPHCTARVHGHGLCRSHYDERRYLQSTARSPEAVKEARRERMIEAELRLGGVAEFQSPHGTNSMFASDEERRAAWEVRREELMARYLTPPAHSGNRPAAWWDYVAERPEHLSDYPEDNFEDSDGDVAAAIDA